MKIIFDFDHTLFSTKKLYEALKESFRKLGIDEKLFQESFQKSKGKERDYNEGVDISGKACYKPKRQFKLIIKQKPEIKERDLAKTFKRVLRNLPQFLYKDTSPFLKKWQKKADLYLLSYGEENFQELKIKNSGIQKYFKKVIITRDIEKSKPFQKIFKNSEKIIFIEDNPQALSNVKQKFKNVITIRINRKEGKYWQIPDNEKIDFSIKNLKELSEILKKVQKKPKCLILFSGGLDSILAAKILMEQKIKTKGIAFKSFFFDGSASKKPAKAIHLSLKVVDFSKEHLKIVKNPKYGYGKAMNPCIDCHILMLKTAKKIMKKEKFDFVATGDVLGERPMSQNKKALELIENEAGLEGYLLRPLSAKLLEPTVPEKLGWVEREKLLDIFGRSRKKQIGLAKKYKIKEYPSPAGGCLLTDLEFGKRLKKLLKVFPNCGGNDIELLKYGRHFWEDKIKIVVGRSEKENKEIKKLKRKQDILIEMKNYPGPLTLVRNYRKTKISQKIIEKAKKLTQYYSIKARKEKDIEFKINVN